VTYTPTGRPHFSGNGTRPWPSFTRRPISSASALPSGAASILPIPSGQASSAANEPAKPEPTGFFARLARLF